MSPNPNLWDLLAQGLLLVGVGQAHDVPGGDEWVRVSWGESFAGVRERWLATMMARGAHGAGHGPWQPSTVVGGARPSPPNPALADTTLKRTRAPCASRAESGSSWCS